MCSRGGFYQREFDAAAARSSTQWPPCWGNFSNVLIRKNSRINEKLKPFIARLTQTLIHVWLCSDFGETLFSVLMGAVWVWGIWKIGSQILWMIKIFHRCSKQHLKLALCASRTKAIWTKIKSALILPWHIQTCLSSFCKFNWNRTSIVFRQCSFYFAQ